MQIRGTSKCVLPHKHQQVCAPTQALESVCSHTSTQPPPTLCSHLAPTLCFSTTSLQMHPRMHPHMYCLAVSCSVLQCIAVCCVLQCLQCVAVCCSVLQCVAVCCSVLQCVAVCCSALQCVAVCCSVSQCVCMRTYIRTCRVLQCFCNRICMCTSSALKCVAMCLQAHMHPHMYACRLSQS